ncbi:MAG TPA: glycosyltransferase, partial [Gemmatimonadaceae bacterium]|nr:glycosyltransferase [Gemmatimonadaceae bacterium]
MTAGLVSRGASGEWARMSPIPRLAIFTSHPIQYQAPYFRALAATGRVHPTVFFGSRHGLDVSLDSGFGTAFQWDVPLLDGYDHVFLANTARRPDVSRFTGVRTAGFSEGLRRGRFDALLVLGWHTAAHVQAIRAAWSVGIPLAIRGESTLQRTEAGIGVAHRLLWIPARQRLYRMAFDRVAAFLVIGSRNRDYYRTFGVPDDKCYWAPYGVDNGWFSLAEPARSLARERVRRRIGVGDDTVVFASSAKLIARKRPTDLVDAVALVRSEGVAGHALFIGDGDERSQLERRAAERGVADAVTVVGFVNQAELPAWYAAADALVLPSDSRETWGLVVNEAMAAGLPVVVSDAAGCSPDLVRDSVNGFTYPCGDIDALADRLARVAALGPAG